MAKHLGSQTNLGGLYQQNDETDLKFLSTTTFTDTHPAANIILTPGALLTPLSPTVSHPQQRLPALATTQLSCSTTRESTISCPPPPGKRHNTHKHYRSRAACKNLRGADCPKDSGEETSLKVKGQTTLRKSARATRVHQAQRIAPRHRQDESTSRNTEEVQSARRTTSRRPPATTEPPQVTAEASDNSETRQARADPHGSALSRASPSRYPSTAGQERGRRRRPTLQERPEHTRSAPSPIDHRANARRDSDLKHDRPKTRVVTAESKAEY